MKNKIIIFICIIITSSVFSQIKSGKILYGVKKINIDSTLLKQDTPDQKQRFLYVMKTFELLKKIKIELLFNYKKSFSHSKNELLKDGENKMQFRTAKLISKTNSEYYSSNIDSILIEKKESFGEIFQITKKINIKDWKLSNLTKKIGGFICYKAERNVTIKTMKGDKIIKQIVWYAPKIPISFGPKEFIGFPGLVLQALDGNIEYTATKLTFNPKEKINIKSILGETITENEYKKIFEKSIENTNSFFKN